jgi:hypothetical protein
MSNSRKREQARRKRIWEQALWSRYRQVVDRVQPAPEHHISGEILVAEAQGHFPPQFRPEDSYRPPNLGASGQYMGYRLLGFGRSEDERRWVAGIVRDTPGDNPPEWEKPSTRSRRSEEAGRRRNAHQRVPRRPA